jgi:MFS family permease
MRLPDISVFKHRSFALFWAARALLTLGWQIMATGMGWQIYKLALSQGASVPEAAFLLGAIGLAQFVPLLALSLFGGQAADRFNRRLILLACIVIKAACAGGLLLATGLPAEAAIVAILAIAAVQGAVNGFQPAAASALMPNLVPREVLTQAIAISSLAFTVSSIAGPALGGVLIAVGDQVGRGAETAFGSALCLLLASATLIALIKAPPQAPAPADAKALAMIKEGLDYVWSNKIVLGAISLDLVVVFLAGAQALMPVFANDVLKVGPEGFGWLRAAPAIGAASVGLVLAAAALQRNVGRWMFGATILFGLCTIVFGASNLFALTMAALIIAGGADMISVYVRAALIQLATPDAMRGRVSAVSFVFISASNELGDFEAGAMARVLGPTTAVIVGGCASVAASALWIRLFPALVRADSLEPEAIARAARTPATSGQPLSG